MTNKRCRSYDPVERYGTDFTVRYRIIDTILEAATKSSLTPHRPGQNIPRNNYEVE